MTGSTTTGTRRPRRAATLRPPAPPRATGASAAATAAMTARECSIPVFTAFTGNARNDSRICAVTKSGGRGRIASTAPGTSATQQVIAVCA